MQVGFQNETPGRTKGDNIVIEVTIPGQKLLRLSNLVLDFNGTIAFDGNLLVGVGERLKTLSGRIGIHVLTADTFGNAHSELAGVPCDLAVLSAGRQDEGKLACVRKFGPESVVSIGNGLNDRLMLRESALGIAVIQEEGAAIETLLAADIVARDVLSALDLLTHPLRIAATLR